MFPLIRLEVRWRRFRLPWEIFLVSLYRQPAVYDIIILFPSHINKPSPSLSAHLFSHHAWPPSLSLPLLPSLILSLSPLWRFSAIASRHLRSNRLLPLSKYFSSLSLDFPPTFFLCRLISSPPSSPLTYQRGQASLFCLKVTRSIWSCCRDTWGNLLAGGRCEESGVDSSGPLVTPDDPVKVATCCLYSWAATVCFKIQQTTCCNLI